MEFNYNDSRTAEALTERTRKFIDESVISREHEESLSVGDITSEMVNGLDGEAKAWDLYAPQMSD